MPDQNKPNVTQDMDNWSVEELHAYRASCALDIEEAKADLALVDLAISGRFLPPLQEALTSAGKEYGTVVRPVVDGYEIKMVVDRKVKWDSGKLAKIAATMPWADASHIFKITFEVPEKIFGALLPSNPHKADIEAARTVSYGNPKVTLEKVEA